MSDPLPLYRRLLWWVSALYLLAIYVTLPYAPLVAADLIRWMGRARFALAMNGTILLVGGAVLLALFRHPPNHWLPVAAPMVVGVLLALSLGNPEERIHFLVYGLLGFLVYFAATGSRHRSMGVCVALVFAAGLVDELIQAVLPNRYWDIKDVLVDGTSGALGAWMGRFFHGALKDRTAPTGVAWE